MSENKDLSFKELSHAISSGDVPAIHAWFKQVEFKSGTLLSAKLCKYITDTPYFFSFSSTLFNKYELEKESLKRQLPVISYFNLKEQLSIFSSFCINEEITIDHFQVLKYSKDIASDRKTILNDLGVHHLFTNLFNKEDFALMDKIEQYLGLDIKSNRMDKIAIHYDKPNIGAFYLDKKKYNTCPLDDIIFNCSENKAEFLQSKGIRFPDFNYVNSLKQKILERIEEDSYFNQQNYSKKIEDKVNYYFINYRYMMLDKSISKKLESIKKSHKI